MNTYSPNPMNVDKIIKLFLNKMRTMQEKCVLSRYRSFIDNTCIIFDITATKQLNNRGEQTPQYMLKTHISNVEFFRLFSYSKIFDERFIQLSSLYDESRYTQCIKTYNAIALFHNKQYEANEYALKFVSIRIR